MKTKICLIRHGITEGNQKRLYYGSSDIPLAEEGVAMLRELAAQEIYPDDADAECYTSGMLRTEQTFFAHLRRPGALRYFRRSARSISATLK